MPKIRKSQVDFPGFLDILGTPWEIRVVPYKDDPFFKEKHADGYCSSPEKLIVVCDMTTSPDYETENDIYIAEIMKETLRHEIVHAFLYECGLGGSCLAYKGPWSKNEEMVDWIANNGEKIIKAWDICKCHKRKMDPETWMKWTETKGN